MRPTHALFDGFPIPLGRGAHDTGQSSRQKNKVDGDPDMFKSPFNKFTFTTMNSGVHFSVV